MEEPERRKMRIKKGVDVLVFRFLLRFLILSRLVIVTLHTREMVIFKFCLKFVNTS